MPDQQVCFNGAGKSFASSDGVSAFAAAHNLLARAALYLGLNCLQLRAGTDLLHAALLPKQCTRGKSH